jgi:ATP-dependent Clp protease adaptor protein ClpS
MPKNSDGDDYRICKHSQVDGYKNRYVTPVAFEALVLYIYLFMVWSMSKNNRDEEKKEDGGIATATKPKATPKTQRPNLYKVILHNDDYTTMDFVVLILKKFFHKNHAEATHLMLYVHHHGRAIVGVYTFDVAETKVKQVTNYAREQGHPLLCTMEPE